MRWITTSLPLAFGGEDDGEDFDVRFSGVYRAGSPGVSYGPMIEPPSPAEFDVYSVQLQIGGPSGNGWIDFPRVLLTEKLEAQLARIGLIDEEARIRRDRETLQDLRDEAAEAERKDRMLARAFDRMEAGWPSQAAE